MQLRRKTTGHPPIHADAATRSVLCLGYFSAINPAVASAFADYQANCTPESARALAREYLVSTPQTITEVPVVACEAFRAAYGRYGDCVCHVEAMIDKIVSSATGTFCGEDILFEEDFEPEKKGL